jgi:hypothetical protein
MSPYLMQPAAIGAIIAMISFTVILMFVAIDDALNGDRPPR